MGFQIFGLGERGVGGGVGGQGLIRKVVEAKRKEIVLHGADAIETPVGVDDGLHCLLFKEPGGLEFGVEVATGLLVGGEIVFGQEDGLTGEGVAQSVQRRAALAFGSDGAGGVGRVFAIDV